jgi:hypothetical protein
VIIGANQTSTYGSTPTINYTYYSTATGTGGTAITSPAGLAGTGTITNAPTSSSNATTYALTYANGLSSTNYTFNPASSPVNFVVNPAILNLTISKTYNGDANFTNTNTYSISGTRYNSDAVPTITSGTASTSSANVATYSSFSSGNLALSNTNYTLVGGTVSATIDKATLTVTADNQSRVYGDVNPTLTYGITGYVAGQNLGNSGVSGTPSITTTAVQGSNVGGYTITSAAGTLTAGNYQFTYVDANLTVNRRPVTVTADDQFKTYGDVNPVLTYQVAANGVGSSRGLYNGQTLTGAVATTVTQATGAGTVPITQGTLTNISNSNYNITFNQGTLTINKASLLVTANADAKFVTQADATNFNGVNYTGFVNGDTATNLGGTLAITRTNATQNNAGVYNGVLQPAGLTSSNYNITYAAGNYTITPAQTLLIDVNNLNVTYGTAPVFVISSVKYMDGLNVIHTLTRDSGVNNTYTYSDGVGGSATFTLATNATQSGSGNFVVGNYSLTGINFSKVSNNFNNSPVYTGNLAVEAKALTASAASVSKVYDGTNSMANLNISLAPVISGDTVTASGQGSFSQASVGTNLGYSVSNLALTGADAGNYYLSGGTTFSGSNGAITKAPLGIAINASYNGTTTVSPSSVTITGLVNNELLTVTSVGINAANVASNNTNYVTSILANTGTATLSNYELTIARNATLGTTTTNKVTLDPVAILVTANNQSRVYGAANPTSGGVTLTSGTLYGGDTLSTATLSSPAVATTAAGQVLNLTPSNQTFTMPGAEQNYTITYLNGQLTVNKAPIGVAVTGTYSGTTTIVPTSYTITGLANNEALTPASVVVNNKNVAANGSNYVTAITPTAGDTANLSNYEFTQAYNGTTGTTTTNKVTINKANLTVSTTASLSGNTYNGTAYTAGYTTTAVNGETFTVSGQATGTNAGTYSSQLVVTGAALANYNTPTIVDANLVISPKAVTITNGVSSSTYDGSTSYVNLMGNAGFTNTALVGSDAIGSVTQVAKVNGSTVTGVAQAGTFTSAPSTAVMSTGLASNYDFTYVGSSNSVAKASLTITAVNATKTYDGLAYSGGNGLSYNGLVNNEQSTVLTGTVTYGGNSQNAINAGTYVITPSGLSSNNYDISYSNGTLTVNKAALTVTAANAVKTYDGLGYVGGNGVSYNGLVNNQSSSVLGGAITYSGTSQNAVNAGTYVITPSGLTSSNYDISFINGSLTVNKATLTVTADNQSRVYGDTNPQFTQTITGFVNGQILSNSGVTGSAVGSTTATASSSVGNYTITSSSVGLSSSNYEFSTVNGLLSIAPRPITVNVDAQTKVYGSSNPTLTFAVSADGVGTSRGLYSSDTLNGALTVAANSTTPVGAMQIVQGALNNANNSNYSITYVGNTLSITPATLSATGSRVYDGGITISGSSLTITGVNGEQFTATGSANLSSKNVQINQPLADVNGLTLSPVNSSVLSNYYPLDVTNTSYTVTVKPVTLTAPSISKTYDGGYAYTMKTNDLTAMSNQLVGGDQVVAASVSFANYFINGVEQIGTGKNAGINKEVSLNSVTINDGNGGSNYSVTRAASNNGVINKAPLTIKAVDDAKFVTTTDAVGYSGVIGNGFVNGESYGNLSGNVVITRTNPSVNNAGVYSNVLVPSGYTSNNYDITYQPGSYTIVPAQTLLIKVSTTAITYGEVTSTSAPAYSYTAKYLPAATVADPNPTPVTVTANVPVNGLYTVTDGVGGSATFSLGVISPSYSSSNRLTVGGYDMTAINPVVSGNNFLSMMTVGGLTVSAKSIAAADLGISAVSKVYDGSAAISSALLSVNAANTQILSGDVVNVYATGNYADADVGGNKSVIIDVALSTPTNLINDARNYSLSTTRITGNLGTITQLAQVTWTGNGSNTSWSNASNWAGGATPTFSNAANMPNVANVIIPVAATVNYDSALVGNSGSQINLNGVLEFNGANNFNFTNNVSGSGSIVQSGAGVLTISGNNSLTGGVTVNHASLTLGSPNALGGAALTSNQGTLSQASGVVLPSLTVNGPVNLASDITSTGNQTYNGAVNIASLANQTTLSSTSGNITFNSTLNAASANQSLNITASSGQVIFGGQVGVPVQTYNPSTQSYTPTSYSSYLSQAYKNLRNLTVTASTILLNADISTAITQAYAGALVVGDNGSNGLTRILLSEDPALTFNGTINDATEGVHNLYLKAVAVDTSLVPNITFGGAIGNIKPLRSLTVDTGLQDSAPSAMYSAIAVGPGNGFGAISIRENVSTVGDQIYTANNFILGNGQVNQMQEFIATSGSIVFNSGIPAASGGVSQYNGVGSASFLASNGQVSGVGSMYQVVDKNTNSSQGNQASTSSVIDLAGVLMTNFGNQIAYTNQTVNMSLGGGSVTVSAPIPCDKSASTKNCLE